ETNRIRSRLGNLQPAPAIVKDDYLVCYCRRGGDYAPRKDGFLVRAESRDGGRTWSAGQDSAFPNPNAAVDFLRLANGHLHRSGQDVSPSPQHRRGAWRFWLPVRHPDQGRQDTRRVHLEPAFGHSSRRFRGGGNSTEVISSSPSLGATGFFSALSPVRRARGFFSPLSPLRGARGYRYSPLPFGA